MAKSNPGVGGKISGSIGATQFRNTKLGTVICNTTVPVQSWSPSKQSSNHKHGNVSRLWAKLTPAQAKAWSDLGSSMMHPDKVGNIIPYRGRDIFNKIMRNRLEINEPFVLDAPKKILPKSFSSIDIDIISDKNAFDIRLVFKPAIDKKTKFIVYATSLLKPGIFSPNPNKFRKISVIDYTFKSGNSLLSDYMRVFKYTLPDPNPHIGFIVKPVSVISGLDSATNQILAISNSNNNLNPNPNHQILTTTNDQHSTINNQRKTIN